MATINLHNNFEESNFNEKYWSNMYKNTDDFLLMQKYNCASSMLKFLFEQIKNNDKKYLEFIKKEIEKNKNE